MSWDTATRLRILLLVAVLIACGGSLRAEWPGCGGDSERSGVTQEALQMPLQRVWIHQANHPPAPAFDDTHSNPSGLPSATYDRAHQIVVAGGRVYYGSSAEDMVCCLDAATGVPLWRFHAEGAVRLAPTVRDGRLYFGSDDGQAYCLDASTGKLLWRFHPAPRDRRIIGSGRFMSQWPIRTGVAVRDGVAYFAAGLLPPHGIYLCAVDAMTGELVYQKEIPWTPEGPIMATEDRLFVPTGITAPLEIDRNTGELIPPKRLDYRRAGGGAFVGTFGEMIQYGPNYNGRIGIRTSLEEPPMKRTPTVMTKLRGGITGVMGRRLLLDGSSAFLLRATSNSNRVYQRRASVTDGARKAGFVSAGPARVFELWSLDKERLLTALKRSGNQAYKYGWLQSSEDKQLSQDMQTCIRWRQALPNRSVSMLVANRSVVVGSDAVVTAYDKTTGEREWSVNVEGTVWDFAVAHGSLYASTDTGAIYCFGRGDSVVPPQTPESRDTYGNAGSGKGIRDYAEAALEVASRRKGFCVVLGANEGRLAFEIAERSDFCVLGLTRNERELVTAREKLTQAGLYGKRVVIHKIDSDTLPYPRHFANLVVSESALSDDGLPWSLEEAKRIVRPYGGALALPRRSNEFTTTTVQDKTKGWAVVPSKDDLFVAKRGDLPGAGQWPHMYADPGNSANSYDRLVRGTQFDLQWIGPPGTQRVINRHWTPMPPLYRDGRLFVLGHDYLTVVDAYNGTYLWTKEVTGASRILMSHNAGSMCVDDQYLHVVSRESCCVLDAGTGETIRELRGPSASSHWGYVATTSSLLFGSNQKPGATVSIGRGAHTSFYTLNKREAFEPATTGGSYPTVSENLFALDGQNHKRLWVYQDGAILNPSISIGGGRIFFAESRNLNVVGNETGRPEIRDFFAKDAYLVALDATTGKKLWEQPFASSASHILYLTYARGMLLSTEVSMEGARPIYAVRGIDPHNGTRKWATAIKKPETGPLLNETNHNQYLVHPAVVGNSLYYNFYPGYRDCVVDIDSGKVFALELPAVSAGPRRCTPFSASTTNVFYRQGPVVTYDVTAKEVASVTGVTRPSCWISVLPAGGLIMMPEAQSTSCRCGYALRTTIVLCHSDDAGNAAEDDKGE